MGTRRFWKSTPSLGFKDSSVESLKSQARWGSRVTKKAVKPGENQAKEGRNVAQNMDKDDNRW